jgi:hypothetical protein
MRAFKTFLFLSILVALVGFCSSLWADSGTTSRHGRKITCASDDGGRHFCRIQTGGGVRLVNQRSSSACIQGRTWGYDSQGIWVDHGCRADFVVMGSMMQARPSMQPPANLVKCESNDGKRKFCPADTISGVRIVKQRSDSPCVQGSTWGYTRKGIWVDKGCRAEFALGR